MSLSTIVAGGNDEFEMKFGKIDKELLQMKSYDLDTGAEALVVVDLGRAYFNYNQTEGDFDLVFERHVRIKFFKKTGEDHASFSIPLFHKNGNKEVLYGLKG
ncbi:MAG: hypothetical protein ACOCXH_09505 [Cyclobacteriaceae bacterium]